MNTPAEPSGCVVRKTIFVDMLFTVFTQAAYACWRGQLDLASNRMGWGYDQTLGTACNVTIGVLDGHSVRHTGTSRSYDDERAHEQLSAWLDRKGVKRPESTLTQWLEARQQQTIKEQVPPPPARRTTCAPRPPTPPRRLARRSASSGRCCTW